MEFLTMGIEEIRKEFWVNPKNVGWIKPNGGLWASPYKKNEELKSEWIEWCSYNMPEWVKNYGVVFKLKTNSKVYTIDSFEDFEFLVSLFGIENKLGMAFLDYEKISKEYDAIYLTHKGMIKTRYGINSLYGWDVESILILNFESIEVENSKYIEF